MLFMGRLTHMLLKWTPKTEDWTQTQAVRLTGPSSHDTLRTFQIVECKQNRLWYKVILFLLYILSTQTAHAPYIFSTDYHTFSLHHARFLYTAGAQKELSSESASSLHMSKVIILFIVIQALKNHSHMSNALENVLF